jgi:hypothetical protein
MRATSLRTAGLWALRAALLRSCLPFAFFDRLFHAFAPFLAGLLIFLVTLGGFSTTVVIMVAVTMMAPFVVIVVATPMMAISITIMIPTAVLVAIVIQYILLAGEGGFATFFAGAAFALAFAARALAGPAFSFTSWTLPRTSRRDSSHFLEFLGLFFSEDGSYFLLVFFAVSAESLTNPLAVFAFPGFSHQFAKGGTLIFLQFFHLQSLFFVEPESLGHGGTAIGAFAAFAAGFGATLSGATSFFVCLHGGGQKTGCEEKNSGFVEFHVCFGDYVLNFGERTGAKTLSVAARDAFGFWLVTMIMS